MVVVVVRFVAVVLASKRFPSAKKYDLLPLWGGVGWGGGGGWGPSLNRSLLLLAPVSQSCEAHAACGSIELFCLFLSPAQVRCRKSRLRKFT